MAEITDKKYLDLAGLTTYNDKIKGYVATELAVGDAAALQSAKDYADGLADNYEVAGAAATAEANAKAYADGKDAAIAEAKKAGTDAAAAAEAAQAAADAAQAAADAAQGEVDTLEDYVGTFTHDTAKSVVEYINAKTDGIATSGNLEALGLRVTTVEGKVTGIEGDYLKDADKTELQGNIDVVSGKVTTLIGEDANKSVRTIANEELAAQLVAEGAKESLDTLAEIAAWIQSHPDDASAMNKAIEDLEILVGDLPEGVTADTIVGYIAEAVAAEKSRAEGVEGGLDSRIIALETAVGSEGSVDKMIDDAVAAEAGLREAADDAMDVRVKALEAIDHSHANQAELDLIESGDKAKWDAAAGQAHTHANEEELNKIAVGDKAKWDAALQASDITTGSANGTIAVKGTDVAVKGLGSAAYTESSAYDGAGLADQALVDAKAYTDAQVAALDDSFNAITTTEINALFPTA